MICSILICNKKYRKTCIFTSLFLRAIINIFIQVIFPNIIKYLDRTFKGEQNISPFRKFSIQIQSLMLIQEK